MDDWMDELTALKMIKMMANLSLVEVGGGEMTTKAMATVDALIERVEKLNNGHEWAWSEYLQAQLKELGLHVVVMVETKTVRDWLVPYEEAGDLEGVPDVLTNDMAASILIGAIGEWPGDFAWDNLQSEVWTAAKDVLDLEK